MHLTGLGPTEDVLYNDFFSMLLSMPSMCACVCTVTQQYNAGLSIERPCIRLPFAAVATIGHFDLSVTPQFTQMCKLIPAWL